MNWSHFWLILHEMILLFSEVMDLGRMEESRLISGVCHDVNLENVPQSSLIQNSERPMLVTMVEPMGEQVANSASLRDTVGLFQETFSANTEESYPKMINFPRELSVSDSEHCAELYKRTGAAEEISSQDLDRCRYSSACVLFCVKLQ